MLLRSLEGARLRQQSSTSESPFSSKRETARRADDSFKSPQLDTHQFTRLAAARAGWMSRTSIDYVGVQNLRHDGH